MKVKDVMVKEAVVLSSEETVADAVEKFAKHRIGGCPVVDDERHILGIMTETNILESLKTHYKELKMRVPPETIIGISFVEIAKKREAVEAFERIANTPVKDTMTREVVTAMPDDELEDVIQKMVRNDVNRIPIVDKGVLVGIVTRGDILRAVQRMLV
ncbi:MAG: CBS domain-containing protein [Candidatus Thermoplasmatota archaeon]|nr:CBS domain-containing protein [Candidatus Thermoplasmatota archaeon]